MSTNIVILDGYTTNPGDNPWEPLEELGELTVYDRTPEDRQVILERAAGAEVLLSNKTPLEAEVLKELPQLEFICMLATGYDVVDVEAAAELGVPVANVPEYASASVAEHTFALLLELTRHVGAHDEAVRRGEWTECADFTFWNHPVTELKDKTLGVVGWGHIGQRVGEIAHGFGMDVLATTGSWKPSPKWEPFEWVEAEELFERADVVSLHCPLTEATRRLADAEMIGRMKEGAFFLNTARGELVDEEALAEALDEGRLGGVAVDVVADEPIQPEHPLLEVEGDNCIITPHNAWTSLEARRRLLESAAENVAAYLEGEPINLINEVK